MKTATSAQMITRFLQWFAICEHTATRFKITEFLKTDYRIIDVQQEETSCSLPH